MLNYLRYIIGSLILTAALAGLAWLIAWRFYDIRLFSVQSDSMSPVFTKGDLVIDTKPHNLNIGDVITYISTVHPGELISHRIVAIKGNLIQTKGDALATYDPPIARQAVIGRPVGVIPRAGYVLDELHRPLVLIGLVYIPALLVTVSELWLLTARYKYHSYGLPKTT